MFTVLWSVHITLFFLPLSAILNFPYASKIVKNDNSKYTKSCLPMNLCINVLNHFASHLLLFTYFSLHSTVSCFSYGMVELGLSACDCNTPMCARLDAVWWLGRWLPGLSPAVGCFLAWLSWDVAQSGAFPSHFRLWNPQWCTLT